MAELVPVDFNPFEDDRLSPVKGNPFANPAKANNVLDVGVTEGMDTQQLDFVNNTLSPQDMEFETSKAYYDTKFGTNHTPEMVTAQIKYEYGADATPQVANQMNRKALKWVKDIGGYTGRLTAGAAAQMPTLRAEMGQLRDDWVSDVVDKFGIDNDLVNEAIKATVPRTPFDLANKTWEMIPTDKLQKWGAEQVNKASETQAEYMSGVPMEESLLNKDFETAGKDFATAVAFEAPRMFIQLAVGAVSPEASAELMFITSAGSKRAEKTEDDSLEERVIAPTSVGLFELITEKILGTQRIADKFSKGLFSKGMKKRAFDIVTDYFGGVSSEVSAAFGENVVDKLSGEEVELTRGLFQAGAVGGFMDVAGGRVARVAMTVGDARRMCKQMTDEQIAEAEASGEFTAEEATAVREAESLGVEAKVEEANQSRFDPSEEEQAFSEDAMATAQKLKKDEGYVEGSAEAMEAQEAQEPSPAEEAVEGDETRITVEADNILREDYGINPTQDPETRTHASLIQESIEADRDINILLDDLKSNPRPTTDFEAADIAREKARLAKELKSASADLSSAYDAGNDEDIARIATEISSLKRRLIDFTNISRKAKTETGRALSAYNLTLNKKKDLTDHVADATAEKGGKLTEKQLDDIATVHNEQAKVEEEIEKIKGEPKNIDEKLIEVRENIDEKKRTIREDKKTSKSEKQKKLETLREIERDQDKMFELIKQLDEQTAKLNDPNIKEDPEGYKATIEILLELRARSQWWKDLKKSGSNADKRRVKLLDDMFKNLKAQYKGKFRDVKTLKEDVSTDEIIDLKNKINYLREVMRFEDKIAGLDEDIRLIGDGRYDEITPDKRVRRENERDERLESLHNELASKRKRLQTLKSDIGTGRGIKFLEFQRAMKLALDSWLLRQGGPSLKSNPFLTLDAWIKSFKGYNEESFYEMQRIVESSESYKASKDKMGVVYNDIDAGFEEHQEAINSSLAEKIPPIAGSNRHMVLGVNLLRWNLSKRMLNKFPNESAEFYEAAGKWINDLTGRGGLGNLESSARGLTAFFTAPRYTTSKWSNIANMRRAWIEKDGKKEFNKDLAKEIAGQKARMYRGYAMMATTLIAMGFEMGVDPEDPLFMKFRKGDVVIDIAPHMTAEIRLTALFMEAFAANSLGIGELEGDYDVDAFNKTLRYAGYKVVPTFGTVMELIEGETVVGEERTLLETLALYPAPIMIEGLYQDALKDKEDFNDILTLQAFQFIGAGGGIYDDTKQDFKRIGD